MSGSFIDSNILIYFAAADPVKSGRAKALLHDGGHISVQVLNETAHVARRKMRFTWAETRELLATVRDLVTVHPLTETTHEIGLELAERYQISMFDGMLAAAAVMARCDTLWSEDMQDGLKIRGGLTVKNPFSL
jgi:predicted nucleic acid-binding protein